MYDAETRALKSRVYVKTQGCCVIVLDGEDEEVVEPEKEKDADVWEGMEEIKTDESDRVVQLRVKRKKDTTRGEEGKRPKVDEE